MMLRRIFQAGRGSSLHPLINTETCLAQQTRVSTKRTQHYQLLRFTKITSKRFTKMLTIFFFFLGFTYFL